MKSAQTLATAVVLLSGAADAFWRMPCRARTGLARLDPLVEPDKAASHAHVIHGGNNFGMSTTYEDLRDSDCTSCAVTQDKSAYWTPSLNFIYENGTTEIVQQVGGMLSYYLLYGDDIKAFPKGFQMLAGDTRLRNFSGPVPDPEKSLWGPDDKTQHALGQKAIGMNCMNYAKTPEASMYRHFLPTKDYMDENCADGIRAELFFPSCWNGKDLDSDNHRDHVAYPDLVNGGVCPKGFETRLPSLFYETIWNTNAFKGEKGQFAWSNGDPTGYGYHGDFINGWEVDFLQNAVNTCTNPSGLITDCPLFDIQSDDKAAKCDFKVPQQLKNDNCGGPAKGLCGNVPIQAGPGYATVVAPGNTDKPKSTYTPPPVTEQPAVPTLSFKAPVSAITDKYGGGISVAAVQAGVEAKPSAKQAESSAVVNAAAASPTPIASSAPAASAPPPPAAPVPTPPPVAAPAPGKVISTSTYTSAGVVYEVAIEEVPVYVTVEVPAPAHKHRRAHLHHRRDREHGLLGRR